MSFGASQKNISFNPFSTRTKEINNNYLFHHKTWHTLYFYNKLDISWSIVQVESSQLDTSSPSYDFTNFSTIFHFLEKENNSKSLNGPELHRPAKALGPTVTRRPTRSPAIKQRGGTRAHQRAHPSYTRGRGWWSLVGTSPAVKNPTNPSAPLRSSQEGDSIEVPRGGWG
jgi:hypothetical protein